MKLIHISYLILIIQISAQFGPDVSSDFEEF